MGVPRHVIYSVVFIVFSFLFFLFSHSRSRDCRVHHRPHRVAVVLEHQAPAYLDEEYPIAIDITNMDDRALEVVVDVLLQPTEIDHAGGCTLLLCDG